MKLDKNVLEKLAVIAKGKGMTQVALVNRILKDYLRMVNYDNCMSICKGCGLTRGHLPNCEYLLIERQRNKHDDYYLGKPMKFEQESKK